MCRHGHCMSRTSMFPTAFTSVLRVASSSTALIVSKSNLSNETEHSCKLTPGQGWDRLAKIGDGQFGE